jgi:hypothetical protein
MSSAAVPRRRMLAVLAVSAAAVAGACRPEPRAAGPAATPSTTAPPSSSRPPAPELPAAYQPARGEVLAEAKRVAGQAVQQLATYQPGVAHRAVAARLLAPGGDPAALLEAAAPMLVPDALSVGEVVYAQLGGLTPAAAAVMVIVRQALRQPDGETTVMARTLDVRLRRASGRWVLDELASAGGRPVARPAKLPADARAVLDDPRIQLPDSARWDIHRGAVDPRLLQAMRAMADRHPYAVSVLISGHPRNVFGTNRRSNHNAGRAVDVYAVAGRLVVHQRRRGSAAYRLARWLDRDGVSELGSPWAFGDGGARSFTNTVHRDHLHLGFDR